MRGVNKRGFLTKKAALDWLKDAQSDGRKGQFIEPSKQRFGAYGTEVIDGLRIGPQTKASYLKNWRNHIEPYPLAGLTLAQLTGLKLTGHYRALEKTGRKDHREGEGLSPRTVRYLHTIISRVLRQAVKDGLLLRNPAEAATPPSAREARPPEKTCWSAGQLAAFLVWAAVHSQHHALWHTLASTGARRRRGRRGPGGRHQEWQATCGGPGPKHRRCAAGVAQGARDNGAAARPGRCARVWRHRGRPPQPGAHLPPVRR
jgi:hypothetical protein